MKKTLFLKVCAVTALLSVAFTASAFAAEKTSEDGVYVRNNVSVSSCEVNAEACQDETSVPEENPDARYIPCPYCGGRIVESVIFTAPWGFTGVQRPCAHGTIGGYDKEMNRVVVYEMRCNRCGVTSQRTVTETTWECHGVT